MHTYLDGQRRPQGDWMGSLVQDQRDASGLLFRRNRYYDPATGQFTQQDPIGIAGGSNLYGFANGDPINFSDPFGLCAEDEHGNEDPECRAVINILKGLAARDGMSDETRAALEAAIAGFEALEADVVFDSDSGALAEGALGGNRGQGPWGYVRINTAAGNPADIGLTAWHELQHRQGRPSTEHRAIYREQANILGGLPGWLGAQAVHTQRVLRSWGVWP
ncbi:RHS repeat-associated core domain-containing protein [Gaopeijia maritima]|uniref:RHS repeat-associated core domain-containing protein n=1 Tax=Gaopeijia maritima TaxID=3119007 RepID=UPI003252E8B2